MYYPRYAGGKFLSNCLALSRHAVFSDCDLAKTELSNVEVDYHEKLSGAMSTLPSDSSQMHAWGCYEHSCLDFFGISNEFYDTRSIDQIKSMQFNYVITDLSTQHDKCFFLVSHDINNLKNMLNVWPNATVIELTNHTKFQTLARNLKKSDCIYADVETFNNSVKFDVSSYFDKSRFFKNLKNLYGQLNFTDFPQQQIEIYYDAYAKLHGID